MVKKYLNFTQQRVGIAHAAPIIADADLAALDIPLDAALRLALHITPDREAGGGQLVSVMRSSWTAMLGRSSLTRQSRMAQTLELVAVKEAADYIAGCSNDEGVAEFLKRYFLYAKTGI